MTFPTEAEARAFLGRMGMDEPHIVVIPTTHGYWTYTGKAIADEEPKICSICGESFREYGNRAWPINDGTCCNFCDDKVVTPARIRLREAEA